MSSRLPRALAAFCAAVSLATTARAAIDPASAAEMRVTAEFQEGTTDHMRFRGFVDMVAGDLRIQADEVDYIDGRKAGGPGARRVLAKGNVVFLRGEERISGDALEMDLETGKGTLTNARGYVQPGVFFEAKSLERLAATKYRVKGARFTSCYQPNPRWSFGAASATFKLDDHVLARFVNFKVFGVPTPLFLPFFYYPIQEDQRSTGLLFPQFGHSEFQGWVVGTGFFWAMGRSLDQTVLYDHMSEYGQRFTHEFRYMRRQPSGGTFTSEFTWPKEGNSRQYRLNWNAVQMLPLGWRATLTVNEYSSTTSQQRTQDNFLDITSRIRSSSFTLQRSFGRNSLQLAANRQDTFFQDQTGNETLERRERLPSARLSRPSQRLGRTGILWSYEARAEQLGLGDVRGTDRFMRFDFSPEISRPIAASFLQLTPRLRVRGTHYGARERSDDPNTEDVIESGFFREPFARRYAEGSLEMRGPSFSRVFQNPTGIYSERLKHVIGPEVTFVYRRVNDSLGLLDNPPVFDPDDLIPDTTEVRYALVQRFLGKRPGPAGKLSPYEFLTWRISQTYYGLPDASKFDPNYYSSFFAIQQEAQTLSPIQSVLRFRPTTRLSSSFTTEYDTTRRQLRRINLSGNVAYDRFSLNGGWARESNAARRVENRRTIVNTLQGGGSLALLPGRLKIDGTGAYDFVNRVLLRQTLTLRYDIQCCGFSVQRHKVQYGVFKDQGWSFQLQLANIGSVGNFGEGDLYGSSRNMGGRR